MANKYPFQMYSLIKRRKLRVLLSMIMSLLFLIGFSQKPISVINSVLEGNVVDSVSGSPLEGVSIRIKGITNQSVTDNQGKFILRSGQHFPYVLHVELVGYLSKDIAIDGSPIQIELSKTNNELSEVVVVGYGTQKKKDLTGSITTVDAAFLANKPLTNSTQALQGTPGLYVNQAGGQPGNDAATIRIRGIGTLNNNNPLVLVNGVEYDLKDINPADIASISVLKDAAAASIYGSRAANGVILVTTKVGVAGKSQVSYNSYYGWQKATYLPDVVSSSVDYMKARNQASIDEGQPVVFSDQEIEDYQNGTDPDLYPNTNWYDIMFRTAPMQDHTVRVSGGSDKVTYNVSLDYLDQKGILLGTGAKRYALNSNINFNLTKHLKAGLNVSGTYWTRYESAEGASSLAGDISRALPIQQPTLSNGNYSDQRFLVPGHNVFRNPYAKSREGSLDTKTERSLANAYLEYSLPFGLIYKINLAVNKYDALQSKFVPEISLYSPLNPDSASSVLRFDNPTARSAYRKDFNNLSTSLFQTLTWNKTIASDHHFNLLVGQSREAFDSSDFSGYVEGFLGNTLTELNAGTTNKDVTGTSSKTRLMSYFGRAAYNYKEKYYLEFDFRNDGSSRFAPGKRWGFFPSIAAAWRLSNESFIKNISAITDLKLRGSWGRLGNQNLPLYSYLNAVNIDKGYSFNNTVVPGSAVTALSDPSISWEATTITNLGLDLNLWNGLLTVVADAYNKKTTDILARINVPAQVGDLDGPVTNLYSMSNKGIEINLSHANKIGRFEYNIGGGISVNRNRVDYLNGDIQYSGSGSLYVIKQGYPVNAYYLYEAEGIFKTEEEVKAHAIEGSKTAPGDIKYKDINGDGVIDSDDRVIHGSATPKFTYQFNLDLSYQRFNLSAFFQGVSGVDMYPMNNLAWPLYNGAGLTRQQLADSWSTTNIDANYPRLGEPKRGSGLNYKNSTFWLQDGSYLRLKNIQLGYDIDERLLNRIGIQKAVVFVNAQNLLTFSAYKLSDPERNTTQNDISEYPSVKTFSVGLNVNF